MACRTAHEDVAPLKRMVSQNLTFRLVAKSISRTHTRRHVARPDEQHAYVDEDERHLSDTSEDKRYE
eukprot:2262374-Prymnesium_polylepis.1